MTELQEEEMPSPILDEEEKNILLKNLDPRIKSEKGNSLWALCFDETVDWNGVSRKNLATYNPIFKYDGPLYCLTLLHQWLFNERQLVRQEGEHAEYDEQLVQLEKLGRMYRTNINK
jgi:hypothetical protein